MAQGNGIVFRPHKGTKNRVKLNDTKHLKADSGLANWLMPGNVIIEDRNIFHNSSSNGMIYVNLDLTLPIGNRRYNQQQQIKSPIINE